MVASQRIGQLWVRSGRADGVHRPSGLPSIADILLCCREPPVGVESRMGAVAWGLWPTPRFPSPLIDTDMPISGIRLSDWLHREAHDGAVNGRRSRRSRPRSP
jgi:hypothetical protein